MNLSKKEGQARRDEARGGIHIPRHADLRGLALHRLGWERALLLVTNIFFIDLLDSLESTLYSMCPTKNKRFFLKNANFRYSCQTFYFFLVFLFCLSSLCFVSRAFVLALAEDGLIAALGFAPWMAAYASTTLVQVLSYYK